MQRLLVISCSQRKTDDEAAIPAILRYDGPAFRVLRKYRREVLDSSLTVLILSAKYGLIDAERPIRLYNCRMTRAAATVMKPQVLAKAERILGSKAWDAVGVCASREYQIALEGLSQFVRESSRFDLIQGGLGLRLTGLRDWLRGTSPV
jgi:hypothetical protein